MLIHRVVTAAPGRRCSSDSSSELMFLTTLQQVHKRLHKVEISVEKKTGASPKKWVAFETGPQRYKGETPTYLEPSLLYHEQGFQGHRVLD